MFLNISNHKSDSWSRMQREEAEKYGVIKDYEFPYIRADATREDIRLLAEEIVEKVKKMHPQVVMCQGEFTLTYILVSRLKECDIKVVAACSERYAEEEYLPDGSVNKVSKFKFVQFREY